jgi:hypothetical protein
MSAIAITSSGSGAGTLSIAAPITATNRTLTLPDATTTLVGTDATQTLTNKTIQGGAITSGTAVASTSGTSIDFTSIPSWVKRITVVLRAISTSGTSIKQIQIGSGSVVTTGYISSATGGYSGNTISGSTATSGFILGISSVAANNGYAQAVLISMGSNIWSFAANVADTTSQAGLFVCGGELTLGGTLDRVRITTVNGTDTFDAGSINILYEG